MATRPFDVVVVGLGSAGMTAVDAALRLGASVCAVERDRVGGDCLWTGCVPSKSLLAAAKAAHTIRHAGALGLPEVALPPVDTAAVLARVRAVQDDLAATSDSPDRMVERGATLLHGRARLVSPTAVEVEGHGRAEGRHVVLCPGSRPAPPPWDDVLVVDALWELERLPASLVVVGGGPIGVETAQACARLGVRVTLLERGPRLLAKDEPELAGRLRRVLEAEGVEVATAVDVAAVEGGRRVTAADGRSWEAEAVLAALGRQPRLEDLGLEQVGVEHTARGIVTDGALRTSVPTVWAAGDAAGRFLFTHSAGVEGARAVRNALFPGTEDDDLLVPWCTYTDPELAHVGQTAAEAREQHGARHVEVHLHELADSDRARAEGHTAGALLLVTAKGRLVGGHALAPAAGELVGELALAIRQGLRLRDLAGVVHAYPTYGLGLQQLGADAAYAAARRWRWTRRLVR
jgi:pyruvate/2-oxoglutarate dehydrogenase complex dihydrolipoamide dehydrogenase (E3) component